MGINDAFRTDSGLSLADEAFVFESAADPSTGAGYAAPRSSLLLQKPSPSGSGTLWLKYGDGDTEWKSVNITEGQPRYAIISGYDGSAGSGKWLEFFHSISSNTSPFVLAEAGHVRALSVAVNGVSTVTFELYKNGSTLVDSLVLTAASTGSKKDLYHAFAINDTLSIKVASGSAKDISLTAFISVDKVI